MQISSRDEVKTTALTKDFFSSLKIMAENSDSAKDENSILTYHQASKMVTCVCGELIERGHTCLITWSNEGNLPGLWL